MLKAGEKYHRLTIIAFSHHDKRNRAHYNCVCVCGTKKTIQGSLLKTGNTKSCGCLGREVRRAKRLSDNHTEITAIMLGYKRHAKGRGYAFSLTREQVESLVRQDCHYCKSKPRNVKVTKNSIAPFRYNGIDRRNNSVGYLIDNCVPCCKICTRAKLDMHYSEFVSWLKTVAAQWG